MARTLLHFKSAAVTVTAARKRTPVTDNIITFPLPGESLNSRVLVLDGTGRVGGSTAIALFKLCPNLRIINGGRNREKGAAMVTSLGKNSEFSEVDINNIDSLKFALNGVDLVVHAAGPFQQSKNCNVL